MKASQATFLLIGNLLWLNLFTAGCSSMVAESGDVKIFSAGSGPTHGSQTYRMVLPTFTLGRADTNVIEVKNLPGYLKGLFHYSLTMSGTYEEATFHRPDPNAAWHDAKVMVAFRKLDGTELYREEFVTSTAPSGFGPEREGWEATWDVGDQPPAEPLPIKEDAFDIVVTVEQPSPTLKDKAILTAFAVTTNAPSFSHGSDID